MRRCDFPAERDPLAPVAQDDQDRRHVARFAGGVGDDDPRAEIFGPVGKRPPLFLAMPWLELPVEWGRLRPWSCRREQPPPWCIIIICLHDVRSAHCGGYHLEDR